MSNTRKTRPIDYRAIRMLQERKKQKLRIRLQQANNQQRAAHARRVSEEKVAEMRARLLSGDMSFTEVQAEIIEDIASRFKPNTDMQRAVMAVDIDKITADMKDDVEDDSFPIVCENGCPEGYLGAHKMSCSSQQMTISMKEIGNG